MDTIIIQITDSPYSNMYPYFDILSFYEILLYMNRIIIVPTYTFFLYLWLAVINPSNVSKNAEIQPPPPPPSTISSLSEKYILRNHDRFRKTYDLPVSENTNSNLTSSDLNTNIDLIFYDKHDLSDLMKDADNYLEKKWRTKILMENTPRGNVVMFYDAFKMGFSYYSDQSMPYSVLNAVSMKYVITFYCRDFFMDETVLADLSPSGITVKHKETTDADKKKMDEEKSKNANTGTRLLQNDISKSNLPFAKFKSYNHVSAKAKSTTANTQLAEEKQTNRFMYLGKLHNFSFIQKYGPMRRVAIPKITNSQLQTSNLYSLFTDIDTSQTFVNVKYSDIEPLTEPGQSDKVCSNEVDREFSSDNKKSSVKLPSTTPSIHVHNPKLTYSEYKALLAKTNSAY